MLLKHPWSNTFALKFYDHDQCLLNPSAADILLVEVLDRSAGSIFFLRRSLHEVYYDPHLNPLFKYAQKIKLTLNSKGKSTGPLVANDRR
jgi:hypothetical protein